MQDRTQIWRTPANCFLPSSLESPKLRNVVAGSPGMWQLGTGMTPGNVRLCLEYYPHPLTILPSLSSWRVLIVMLLYLAHHGGFLIESAEFYCIKKVAMSL